MRMSRGNMNRDGAAARLMIIVATASERQCSDLI